MNRIYRICMVLFVMMVFAATASAQPGGKAPPAASSGITHEDTWDAQTLRQAALKTAARLSDSLFSLPLPAGYAGAPEKAEAWNKQTAWIASLRSRLNQHASDIKHLLGMKRDANGIQKMGAMNTQFLALQEAVQNESRAYANSTGDVRTRHNGLLAILIRANVLVNNENISE